MRNLKLLNHWIAELRDLAIKYPVQNIDEHTGETSIIPLSGIKKIFDKESYQDDFESGYTPQESFENTLEAWQDAS